MLCHFGADIRKERSTMSMKTCPFCRKEISNEAIICKFCHRLLIDENGKDIGDEKDNTPAPAAADEDKTIVYSKDELRKALHDNENDYADEQPADEADEDAYEEYQEPAEEAYDEQYADEQYAYEDDGYDSGEYTYDEQSEGYADAYEEEYEQPAPQQRYRSAARDMMADDIPPVSDYDPKRTFIITIIVTLGILLIIIAAIVVGFKLFGFSDENAKQSQVTAQTPAPTSDTQPSETAPVETEYVPQVTDDTTSESPEETSNSGLADPVVTPDSMVVVPEDSAADSTADSSTDTASDSTADDSAADSAADSSTESSADESQVNDGPAGQYYTWDEAFDIIENYFASNGMNGTYAYAYGEENTSMTFQYYDEDGNPAGLYTVDLYTGAVSAA